MELTVTKNGQRIDSAKAMTEIATTYDNIMKYVLDSMIEAANATKETMVNVITDNESMGRLANAYPPFEDFSERWERVQTSGIPDAPRINTYENKALAPPVQFKDNIRIYPEGKTIFIGAHNAPPWYFGQDQGWDRSTAPNENTLYQNAEGMFARDEGMKVAKAILDQRFTQQKVSQAATGNSPGEGIWLDSWGECPF